MKGELSCLVSIDICRTMLRMFYGFVVAIAMLRAGMRQDSRMRVDAMLQEGKNNIGYSAGHAGPPQPETCTTTFYHKAPQEKVKGTLILSFSTT